MNTILLPCLLGTVFLTVVFLHLARKNLSAVVAYGVQSLAVVIILLNSYFETRNFALLLVVLVTAAVKVMLTPIFFAKLIRKHELTFSVSTYVNVPLTLVVLAVLTAIAHSENFAALTNIVTANHALLSLALSTLFISLFLIINRKGALSQTIGVLSLENSIVAFAIFAGLEQSPMLQIGIVFDIAVWILIASVFISMIYRHFQSIDTSLMKHLQD